MWCVPFFWQGQTGEVCPCQEKGGEKNQSTRGAKAPACVFDGRFQPSSGSAKPALAAEIGVQIGHAVDDDIEVGRGAEIDRVGLIEVAIVDDIGLAGVVTIDIGQVLGEGLAIDGEVGGIEDMQGAGFQRLDGLIDLSMVPSAATS